jgi:hypothetical protein
MRIKTRLRATPLPPGENADLKEVRPPPDDACLKVFAVEHSLVVRDEVDPGRE